MAEQITEAKDLTFEIHIDSVLSVGVIHRVKFTLPLEVYVRATGEVEGTHQSLSEAYEQNRLSLDVVWAQVSYDVRIEFLHRKQTLCEKGMEVGYRLRAASLQGIREHAIRKLSE